MSISASDRDDLSASFAFHEKAGMLFTDVMNSPALRTARVDHCLFAAFFADFYVEALDLLVQGRQGDAELLGCVSLVPVAALELLDDDALLNDLKNVKEGSIGIVRGRSASPLGQGPRKQTLQGAGRLPTLPSWRILGRTIFLLGRPRFRRAGSSLR